MIELCRGSNWCNRRGAQIRVTFWAWKRGHAPPTCVTRRAPATFILEYATLFVMKQHQIEKGSPNHQSAHSTNAVPQYAATRNLTHGRGPWNCIEHTPRYPKDVPLKNQERTTVTGADTPAPGKCVFVVCSLLFLLCIPGGCVSSFFPPLLVSWFSHLVSSLVFLLSHFHGFTSRLVC